MSKLAILRVRERREIEGRLTRSGYAQIREGHAYAGHAKG
jgi:hypothetical protein